MTFSLRFSRLFTFSPVQVLTFFPFVFSQGKLDVNSKDEIDHTPLHIAVIQGATCVVEELVCHGADVNVTNAHGVTPLHALISTRDTMEAPTDACPEMNRVNHSTFCRLEAFISLC